ncbi:hypothetical protein Ciccas_003867 [Cichlidogyrus casuarinus]|uniref:Uncharacterized protein n=1 Tax=Cichlidogyrus casuarinus TaxID=1844966 RepID=A0ABD2QD58_9PLAT
MKFRIGSQVEITEDFAYVPEIIYDFYLSIGVRSIFAWQAECLRLPGVLTRKKNLVYSAPTSAGKTLVAELILLKTLLETDKKVFFILPYVSVSHEKMIYLKKMLSRFSIKVGGFMGALTPHGGLNAVRVALCTIEKANGLINRLIEQDKLDDLGLVVVDELHMVGDTHRGYILELLLTKLLAYSTINTSTSTIDPTLPVQIVGMSATLPNLPVVADWLNAKVYISDFRPIELKEFLLIKDPAKLSVYKITGSVSNPLEEISNDDESLRSIIPADLNMSLDDEDGVFGCILKTVMDGNGVLVFCPIKKQCELLSSSLASKQYFESRESTDKISIAYRLGQRIDRDSLTLLVNRLEACPAGLDKMLFKSLGFGVAFHHAGLTIEEREIIENGFRSGIIKVLIATSTLCSGVNLPARRVIIRSIDFNRSIIDMLTYKQMAGRAGRKGVDTEGPSVLTQTLLEVSLVQCVKPLEFSTLSEAITYLKSTLLYALESKKGDLSIHSTSTENLTIDNSLRPTASQTTDFETNSRLARLEKLVRHAISRLRKTKCVQVQKVQLNEKTVRKVHPTPLGRALLASAIGTGHGLLVFDEIDRARRSIALDTDLHLVFLVSLFT